MAASALIPKSTTPKRHPPIESAGGGGLPKHVAQPCAATTASDLSSADAQAFLPLTPILTVPKHRQPLSDATAHGTMPPFLGLPDASDSSLAGSEAAIAMSPFAKLLRSSSQTINTIRELHRTRDDLLRTEGNLTRTSKSIIKRAVGWNAFLEPKLRKVKEAEADVIYRSICSGTFTDASFVAAIATQAHLAARNAVTEQLGPIERNMVRCAKQLHVAPFVEKTRGFGWIGLAQIVGEVGDLSLYANPAKLWKRCGLAPFYGKACSTWRSEKLRHAPALTKADWIEAGYSPRRRSLMFSIGDALIKQQGPYRELYLARKVYEQEKAPTLTKMAWHRRAQRYMEKRLLRDLWRAWTASEVEIATVEEAV